MKRPNRNSYIKHGQVRIYSYSMDQDKYIDYLEIQVKRLSKSHSRPKPVIWDGKVFPSLEKMAKELKVNPQNLRYYLKNDKPFGGSFIDYQIELNNK